MRLKNGKRITHIKLMTETERSLEIFTVETMNEGLHSNGLPEVSTVQDGVMQIHESGKFVSIVDYNRGIIKLFETKKELRKYIKATKKIAKKEQEKQYGSSMFLI